jgi:hypothetical protein
MGIGECTDEAVHLKVSQPVCLTFLIHHAHGRKGQQSVGRVLKFGENEVIMNLRFQNHSGSQIKVAVLKEDSQTLTVGRYG